MGWATGVWGPGRCSRWDEPRATRAACVELACSWRRHEGSSGSWVMCGGRGGHSTASPRRGAGTITRASCWSSVRPTASSRARGIGGAARSPPRTSRTCSQRKEAPSSIGGSRRRAASRRTIATFDHGPRWPGHVVTSRTSAARSPRVRATGLLAGARAALRSGSPSRAQSRLRAARLIIEQKKIRVMRCEALLFDAWVALDRGAWDKVSNLSVRLSAAIRASDWLIFEPLVPLLRGRASLGAGRPDEAQGHLARAASLARSLGSGGFLGLAVALERQSGLLVGVDIEVRPDITVDETEVVAVVQENAGLRGLLAGDDEGAAKAFEQAVETWSTMGRTAWLARSLALQAVAANRRGDRRRAGRLYRRAEAVLDELKTPARNRMPILSPVHD